MKRCRREKKQKGDVQKRNHVYYIREKKQKGKVKKRKSDKDGWEKK